MKNKKKLTLNQTWTLCLRMWRWIAKVWQTKGYKGMDVHDLKRMWLREHGFESSLIRAHCFFCDYKGIFGYCHRACPGALVNPDFNCMEYNYDFENRPVEFYKELLRLNRIRKGKQNGQV